jgi:pimeloyl-ACP methyl ester carboxylesterase
MAVGAAEFTLGCISSPGSAMKSLPPYLPGIVPTFAVPAEPAAARPLWPIPAGLKTVDVDGYPIAFTEAGQGETVLILHGALFDHRLWLPQVETLSKAYRVIAPSLRHFWPEPWSGHAEPVSYRRLAADAVALIRALDLGPVHLLGHSLGGAVAVEVARTQPALLRSLVLVDPFGPQPLLGEEGARRIRERVGRLAAFVGARLAAGSDRTEVAHAAYDLMMGAGAWDQVPPTGRQRLADNVGTSAAPPDPDPPGLDPAEAASWRFPILLLHGERSGSPYREIGAVLRRCCPAIPEPTIIPNAGHGMMVENRADFEAALLRFLSNR